jgi:hypothetical protein
MAEGAAAIIPTAARRVKCPVCMSESVFHDGALSGGEASPHYTGLQEATAKHEQDVAEIERLTRELETANQEIAAAARRIF